MTITNDLRLLLEQVRYEVSYVDYAEDQFTVPVILTKERAERLVNDASVRRVRFTPIISASRGDYFTFEGSALIYSTPELPEPPITNSQTE